MLIKTRIKSSTELSSYKMLTVCPLLVVTTTVTRALAMALAFVFALFVAQVIVAVIKKRIPLKLRSLFFIAVTAFAASVTELLVWWIAPGAAESLGVYLSVIAVSCIILIRLESTKTDYSAGTAILDSVVTGAQMMILLLSAAFLRELFGLGKIFSDVNGQGGLTVFKSAPVPIFATTTGLLFLCAIGAAVAKLIVRKKKAAAKAQAIEAM